MKGQCVDEGQTAVGEQIECKKPSIKCIKSW